jgi:ferric-dicitrate binding protein FerR (iron transport regulator)
MPMNRNRIIELYSRILSKEASDIEQAEFAELLKSEDEQFFHELITSWWNIQTPKSAHSQSEKDDHFNYILSTATADQMIEQAINVSSPGTNIKKMPSIAKWSLAIAAVLIGLVLSFQFGLPGMQTNPTDKFKYNEIVAKRGTKSKLILPDGTQVWLNSESKLSYGASFNDSIREVTLEGEAYFDVVKDKNRPFIVKTSAISIRVLGTAFNVKSYNQDPTIETTLVRGLIEVQKNNEPSASKIILRPNEKLVYNKPEALNANQQSGIPIDNKQAQLIFISPISKYIPDSARVETSWVYGRLIFDGDTFAELAEKMERWYNIKITIKNQHLAANRFGGVFENENVEEALKALQLIAMFKYTIHDSEIIIE